MDGQPNHSSSVADFREAASALRSARGIITTRFIESVAKSGVESDPKHLAELESRTAIFLDELARTLEGESKQAAKWMPAPTGSADQCLAHFRLFRTKLLQELPAAMHRPLRSNETVAINDLIDRAVADTVSSNVNYFAERFQAETSAMAKFLSFLSHDLRGGLNAAVLMIEVLRRQLSGEPKFSGSLDDLGMVRRSVLDTVDTLERFVTAERLRIGRIPVNLGRVNTVELLADLRKRVASLLADAGMQLETICPDGLVIQSDRSLVTWILYSLIANSIKFARSGTVRVTFQLGAGCRMTVSDHGPGIAPGKIEELFQSLVRGESYSQKGVGLGLYVVYHACLLLKAKLSVESTVGKGTSFHVDLPPT